MLNEMLIRAYVALMSTPGKQRGASAVEYALIIAIMAAIIIAALALFGTSFDDAVGDVACKLDGTC